MSDEKTTNLETTEEGDANLAKKFGHVEKRDFDKQNESKKEVPSFSEKEISQEIPVTEKDSSYNKILSKIKKKSGDDKDTGSVVSDAKSVSQKTDSESQIKHLVGLAINKDVVYAVKVAKHLEDNYVLDMFHDKLLSDELHDALVRKGLIK